MAAVPVLMYHALAEPASPISVSPALFAEQMKWLHEHGYTVLSLQHLVELLHAAAPLPEQAVAITFDDGFETIYRHACPVLAEYGFVATVFLVSAYIGGANNWPGQPPSIPRFPLMTWSQIDETDRVGVLTYGAHTISHPCLDRLPESEVERELHGSKQEIEQKLGRSVDLFAYPYGRLSAPAQAAARRLFRGACSIQPGPVRATSDLWALERIEVQYLLPTPLFHLLAHPLLTPYLVLRATATRTITALRALAQDG